MREQRAKAETTLMALENDNNRLERECQQLGIENKELDMSVLKLTRELVKANTKNDMMEKREEWKQAC